MSKGKKAKAVASSAGKPPWRPMLEDFVQVFGLPKVPTVMEKYPDELKLNYRILKQRMPDLKPYQVDCIIRNATKQGGIIAGTMGSGKTRMVLGTLILRGHFRNLIIVPPALVDNWLATCKHYNLYAEPLLSHTAVSDLRRRYMAGKKLKPEDKKKLLRGDQEFYITTPQFLALGGLGNLVYDKWNATYTTKRTEVDPITGAEILDSNGKPKTEEVKVTVESTKYSAKDAHSEAKLAFGSRHFFWDHVDKCPKCNAGREFFTKKGHCRNCGYTAYSYKGRKTMTLTCSNGHSYPLFNWILKGECPHPECGCKQPTKIEKGSSSADTSLIKDLLSGLLPEETTTSCKTHSVECFPAYKRLKGIFGAKAIDEAHLLANFNSQQGMAVFCINTKESWVASGTIARGYVTDLEASLCHAHKPLTPIFPFAPWDRAGFREQFVTERVKKSILANSAEKDSPSTLKPKVSISQLPEASNINRLRRMLNCVTTSVPESILESEWKLPPLKRHYHAITLNPKNTARYLEELARLTGWFKSANDTERRHGAMSRLWNLRTICEGEEKLLVAQEYINQWRSEKRKFVVTCGTKCLFQQVKKMLDKIGVNYLAVDEKIPADQREAFTAKFSDPQIECVLSRTKLINVGLNTLVHADRLLCLSLDYSPDTLRQLEKRLNRPGQKSNDVLVVYPVVRMRPKMSVEERMLKLTLEKEVAVKEMTEGKIKWKDAAILLEAAREKKGAAKVLQEIMSNEASENDRDLESLFSKAIQVVSPEEQKATVEREEDSDILDSGTVREEIRKIWQTGQLFAIEEKKVEKVTKPKTKKAKATTPTTVSEVQLDLFDMGAITTGPIPTSPVTNMLL